MKPLPACLLLLATLGPGMAHAAEAPPGPTFIESPQQEPTLKLQPSTPHAPAIFQPSVKYAAAVKAELDAQALLNARTQSLGAEARETLRASLLLAEALSAQDRNHEAEPMLKKLLPVVARVFGAEDPETLRCQSDLSKALAGQAKWAKAEALCRSLLPAQLKVLGAHYQETLLTRRRLAGALFELGSLDKAAEEYHLLVMGSHVELGAENAATLEARLLQAQCIHAQERHAEAATQLRELLPVLTHALGAEHHHTLACQSELCAVTADQGQNAEAAAQYRSLIPIETRALGAGDLETLRTRWRFAGVLFEQGQRTEAEKQYRQALTTSLRALNAVDSKTLSTRTMEGANYHLENKYTQAAGMRRALVPYLMRLLGTEHPYTLQARADLAEDLAALGLQAEAGKELRAVLRTQTRVLGALNPDTLNTCGSLAECLQAQDMPQEALTYAQRALAGRLKVLKKDAAGTLASQLLVTALTHPAPAPRTEAPRPAPKDRTVATVNGTPIMASDLRQTIKAQEDQLRYQYQSEPKRLESELSEVNNTALDTLIDKQLLLQEFKRIGGVLKPEYVEDDINNIIKESFKGDRAAFLSELAKNGLSFEEFRTLREQMVKLNAMRFRIAGDIEFKDGELEDYYEKNKQLWRGPEEVKISTLTLLKTFKKKDTETHSQARSLRTQILKGADFAAIARKESGDSHADDGGAWDWTPVANLSEDVRNAVAKTTQGALSEIIEAPGSFILLRVDDRRSTPPPPLDKVKEEVTKALEKELGQKRVEMKLEKLRETADIQFKGPV